MNNSRAGMMDLHSELMQIGFTEYEAKVYLALLANHPATGYQLSKESGVPRSMVYETLRRLHDRGAAQESIDARSTQYRPLPPHTLLDQHEREHFLLLDKLRQGLEELYAGLPDERVWSISGRSATLAYAIQLLRQAAADVYLVLADADLEALRREITSACGREVTVNILLTGEGKIDCGCVAYHPPLESQLQGLTTTLLVVVDDVEALIASTNPHMETRATITRNSELVLIARQFVWMELFAQRVYACLGVDLLNRLDSSDRQIFNNFTEIEME